MTRLCLPNPDEQWPDEAMSAQMAARQVDAIAGLCPIPSMAEILREAAGEREALREAFDRIGEG